MSVIVTGGALGIGRATVEQLLAQGERVVVVDRDVSPLETLQYGDRLIAVAGDVTSPEVLERAGHEAGEVSGVVACAGISRPGPSDTYSLELWNQLIAIDLTAVFSTFQIAARVATDGASFVAISSISGIQGFAGRAAYGAAKAGVDGLVRSLAAEYAPRFRVNAIAPGYVMTDLVRANMASGAINERALLNRTPLGRLGTPEDIANGILFLLSDKASWITGTTLSVDGGWASYGLGLGTAE
jgi:NAD(P)-dependent dehydrogenase (short-subunit alcohol dehydrogenase family)